MENKTSKYFKYAIGEILLVVIGILIALQINNWNENRLQHQKDIEFLNSLRSELVIDTTSLSTKYQSFKNINSNIEGLLISFDTITNITAKQYQNIISDIMRMEVLTPVGKNLQKNDIALANGTLARIEQQLNDDYLAYIEMTKSNNDVITKFGETLQQISIQHIMPTIDYQMDAITINYQSEFNTISNSRLFRNALERSKFYRGISISYMESQIETASALINSVDEYLNDNKPIAQ